MLLGGKWQRKKGWDLERATLKPWRRRNHWHHREIALPRTRGNFFLLTAFKSVAQSKIDRRKHGWLQLRLIDLMNKIYWDAKRGYYRNHICGKVDYFVLEIKLVTWKGERGDCRRKPLVLIFSAVSQLKIPPVGRIITIVWSQLQYNLSGEWWPLCGCTLAQST